MRKLADLFSFTALIAATVFVAASVPMAAADDPGKGVFLAQKCNMCHSVDSQQIAQTSKMAGGDLSAVGSTRDAAWLTQFLKKEAATAEGKKHSKEWKGTDAELAQLTAWLDKLEK